MDPKQLELIKAFMGAGNAAASGMGMAGKAMGPGGLQRNQAPSVGTDLQMGPPQRTPPQTPPAVFQELMKLIMSKGPMPAPGTPNIPSPPSQPSPWGGPPPVS